MRKREMGKEEPDQSRSMHRRCGIRPNSNNSMKATLHGDGQATHGPPHPTASAPAVARAAGSRERGPQQQENC